MILCLLGAAVSSVSRAQHVSRAPHWDAPDGTTFRFVSGGRFVQGTSGGERVLQEGFPLSTTGQNYGNAEGPAHVTWVTKPFWVAKTEVTVAQFREFVDATGYQTSAENGDATMVGWRPTPEDAPLYKSYDFLRDATFSWRSPGFEQGDDHPVVGVSWRDAKAYCQWRGEQDDVTYRLPSEAEWELVCRAGTATWFSFGDVARGVVQRHANLGNVELERFRQHAAERQWLLDWENDPSDRFVFTAPVASFQENPWGLHDLHGNVWEWCEDLWLDTVYKDYMRPRYDAPCGIAVDPINVDRPQTDTNDFHVIRGGSWYNGDLFCRSANRTYWDATDAACYVGFRLVRDVQAEELPEQTLSAAANAYRAEQRARAAVEDNGGKFYSSRGIDLEIRFESESLGVSLIRQLKHLPDLQRLRIRLKSREEVLSQDELDAISNLSTLRELEFQGGTGIETLDLSSLTRLTALRSLRFARDSPLSDAHLGALSPFVSLTEFVCFGTAGGLTDRGVVQLDQNRGIAVLEVWETDAKGEFLAAFVGCPLSKLACTAGHGSRGALQEGVAAALESFSGLSELILTGQSQLGGETLQAIGSLDKLRRLELDQCVGFEDHQFSSLSSLSRLENLNLMGSRAGDSAASAVKQIPRLRSLRIGGFSEPLLTDQGMRLIGEIFSLQELTVASDAVTDAGLAYLGRVNRLRDLSIESNQINGEGLGPICRLPELSELDLRTPGLQNVAFSYLKRAKSLRKLRLAHRGVRPPQALTNEGLSQMVGATWLSELWLPRNDTGISETAINALKDKMPKTGVIPYTVDWN